MASSEILLYPQISAFANEGNDERNPFSREDIAIPVLPDATENKLAVFYGEK